MWSLQQICWTMTNRVWKAWFALSVFISACSHKYVCVLVCVCWTRGILLYLCINACSHAASELPRALAALRGHRWDTEWGQAGSWSGLVSVTLDRWCVCVSTSVRQLPSACRSTGVYSSSLLLLTAARLPVTPRPTNRARRPQDRVAAPHDSGSQLLFLFKN